MLKDFPDLLKNKGGLFAKGGVFASNRSDDCWILWEISDRHRCSGKFSDSFLEIIFSKKYVFFKSQNSIRISSKSQYFNY